MSQFSQKYYKHYKIEKKDDEVLPQEFEFWVWTRDYRIFELIIIALLLLILFCVCQKKSVVAPLHSVVQTQRHIQKTQEDKVRTKVEQNASVTVLQEKIPHLVLPDLENIVPKGIVSLQDYMYFVYDTNANYPIFIDPQTGRIIKDKRPQCVQPECPVTQITQKDKEAYMQWLAEMTNKEFTLTNTKNGFIVREKK